MKAWQILLVSFLGALEGALLGSIGFRLWSWQWFVIVVPVAYVIGLTLRAVDRWWASRKSDKESTPTTTCN